MPLTRQPQLAPQNQSIAIGLNFPFKETQSGGIFMPTRITSQSIKSDLIALLTYPIRSRVMHNNLFSPLPQAIFENWTETEQDIIDTQLKAVIRQYATQISVSSIDYTFSPTLNTVDITISYSIPSLGLVNDFVNTTLNLQS